MLKNNPLRNFTLDKERIWYVGSDLQRPECILAERDGSLWSADARGGVVHIEVDGTQRIITQKRNAGFENAMDKEKRFFEGTLPNGLAFAKNGDFLIADFGTDCLYRMKRTGEMDILLDNIDGERIGKVNFVLRDSKERLWITVTTKKQNWLDALVSDLDDGYIIRLDERGAHIVADGLHFTNEVRFDADERYLYVVETTGGRILRYQVDEHGDLHGKEIFGPTHMGAGAYPDGIAFDSYGNLWGTMVYSDKLFAITPDGEMKILLDEGDPEKVKKLDEAFWAGKVTQKLLFETGRGIAPWMASVTFASPDLSTACIGSLKGTRIPCFHVPWGGLPMVHWFER